ncbi:hypothetical protein [Propionivibrio soli]|uniref:hypothetical protein n=1 Tax=Propionivibrio soli TaxID=2976531 RepID=UPI0021E6F0F6|nr:hypothetical protein [Propionivibrio soli]
MKSLSLAILLGACAFHAGTVQAQGVYMTPGEKGPVFSDKPRPGAKEVTLPPLTVMPAPKVAPSAPAAEAAPAPATPPVGAIVPPPDAPPPGYRQFSVVYPENNGSIVANTAVFDVRLAVDPPLRVGDGHAFVLRINGRPVARRFTSTEIMVPPEFWGDTLPPPNQLTQVDASIVDNSGQVVMNTEPVLFYLRYATVLNHTPRRPLPPPGHVTPPQNNGKTGTPPSGLGREPKMKKLD